MDSKTKEMDGKTKELEYLLNNYWCIKDNNPNLYYSIKNNLDYYKNFIQNKLGSRLIVNDRFIKLEKIPACPKAYMGINAFKDKIEYVMLFIILLFLEDKPKLEQFILSDLIEYITNTAISLKLNTIPNWNLLHHRKCLSNVINHLKDVGIIKIVDEQKLFTEDKNAEALYETTGISNYYVREFKNNILEYQTIEDYINDEFTNQNENIGDVRRYKVYRHLFYSLVSYTKDLTEFEIDYIRKFRSVIKNELSKYTASELEVSKNMQLLLYPYDKESFDFPNNKAISDIVLMVNYHLLQKIDEEKFILPPNEILVLSKEEFKRIIKEVRNENIIYFSKNHREMSQENFINEVINYMKEYDFIKEEENTYHIYPIVSKFIGYIPKNYEKTLDLFGGEIDESK